jgi:hypothetical protein
MLKTQSTTLLLLLTLSALLCTCQASALSDLRKVHPPRRLLGSQDADDISDEDNLAYLIDSSKINRLSGSQLKALKGKWGKEEHAIFFGVGICVHTMKWAPRFQRMALRHMGRRDGMQWHFMDCGSSVDETTCVFESGPQLKHWPAIGVYKNGKQSKIYIGEKGAKKFIKEYYLKKAPKAKKHRNLSI